MIDNLILMFNKHDYVVNTIKTLKKKFMVTCYCNEYQVKKKDSNLCMMLLVLTLFFL
jgi:hypothetical protein